MSTNARSGHGTIYARETAANAGTYTDIAELNDIVLPELSRNEFDATTQNEDIDSYVLGVLRRGAVTVSLNFLPTDGGHDHLTGLVADIKSNVMKGHRFTVPGDTPWVWISSGQVQKVAVKAPVDGKLSADVTLRLSGRFSINGVLFG